MSDEQESTEGTIMAYVRTEEQRARLTRLIEALQSGEYVKTCGTLREARGDRMCCLGVGCDLIKKHEGIGDWVITTSSTPSETPEYVGFSVTGQFEHEGENYAGGVMPGKVAEMYGLNGADVQAKLYTLNDYLYVDGDERPSMMKSPTWDGSGVIEELIRLRDEVLPDTN